MGRLQLQFSFNSKIALALIFSVGLGFFGLIIPSANFAAHAGQNYAFKVKVKNETGKKIRVRYVQWQPKGGNKYKWNSCNIDLSLDPGKNKTLTCYTRASVKKWKRRFEMAGYCYDSDGSIPSTMTKTPNAYFPLTKKWFARSWSVKNNNTYTLSFRKDQFCR